MTVEASVMVTGLFFQLTTLKKMMIPAMVNEVRMRTNQTNLTSHPLDSERYLAPFN